MNELQERWAAGCFTVVDFETTGLHAHNCRAIEIGIARFENWQATEIVESFILPADDSGRVQALPAVIVKITSITDAMLVGAPKFDKLIGEIDQMLQGELVVAYNASFDRRFMTAEMKRAGVTARPYLEQGFQWIDPLQLARVVQTEAMTHKLFEVAQRLGISIENLHRAGDDAVLAGQVLAKLHELTDLADLAKTLVLQQHTAGRFAVRRSRGKSRSAAFCELCGDADWVKPGEPVPPVYTCSEVCRDFLAAHPGDGSAA